MSRAVDDRQAITDLAVAYARAVDARDFEALRELFTADATAELGGSGQVGVEEIIERLQTALAPYVRWEHRLGAHEVTVAGDAATARCEVDATHVRPEGESPAVYTVAGTYEDRLLRTADGWRITHRSLIVERRI